MNLNNKLCIFQWTNGAFSKWSNSEYSWVGGGKTQSMHLPITHVDLKSNNLKFTLEFIYD